MNDAAMTRAQLVAIERHRRLHNEAVESDEARIINRYLADIAAYVTAPDLTEVVAMREP